MRDSELEGDSDGMPVSRAYLPILLTSPHGAPSKRPHNCLHRRRPAMDPATVVLDVALPARQRLDNAIGHLRGTNRPKRAANRWLDHYFGDHPPCRPDASLSEKRHESANSLSRRRY